MTEPGLSLFQARLEVVPGRLDGPAPDSPAFEVLEPPYSTGQPTRALRAFALLNAAATRGMLRGGAMERGIRSGRA